MATNKTTADSVTANAPEPQEQQEQVKVAPYNEKTDALSDEKHLEDVGANAHNLVYDDVDEEPELHARTYVALLAMFVLNMVQVFALQGPPAVVSTLT
jgi:hypothetical protein